MTTEEAKAEIKRRMSPAELLERSKNGFYKCPHCGSGTHANGTGAVHIGRNERGQCFTCHSCGFNGDAIDIYRELHGCGFLQAVNALAARLGVSYTERKRTEGARSAGTAAEGTSTTGGGTMNREQKKDYSAYIAACRERLTDPAAAEYLAARGISLQTAQAHGVGYDAEADPAGTGHKSPRLIIPTSGGHYVARALSDRAAYRYINPAGAVPGIFNAAALRADVARPVFVTEGAIDALSVLEAGQPAIALNSTTGAGRLLRELEERPTRAELVLCLDNDSTGTAAAAELAEQLTRLKIRHRTADICGGRKDPNAYLQADRAAFIATVTAAAAATGAVISNKL